MNVVAVPAPVPMEAMNCAAAWSPTGRYVVTGSEDGTARVWLTRTEDLLALAERRTTRAFTEEERAKYAGFLGDGEHSVSPH